MLQRHRRRFVGKIGVEPAYQTIAQREAFRSQSVCVTLLELRKIGREQGADNRPCVALKPLDCGETGAIPERCMQRGSRVDRQVDFRLSGTPQLVPLRGGGEVTQQQQKGNPIFFDLGKMALRAWHCNVVGKDLIPAYFKKIASQSPCDLPTGRVMAWAFGNHSGGRAFHPFRPFERQAVTITHLPRPNGFYRKAVQRPGRIAQCFGEPFGAHRVRMGWIIRSRHRFSTRHSGVKQTRQPIWAMWTKKQLFNNAAPMHLLPFVRQYCFAQRLNVHIGGVVIIHCCKVDAVMRNLQSPMVHTVPPLGMGVAQTIHIKMPLRAAAASHWLQK